MPKLLVTIALVMLTAAPCLGWWDGDCRHSEPREASVSTDGVTGVELDVGPGSLHLEGRADLAEVRVHGTACAKREELLDEIELVVRRSGDRVLIETRGPRDYLLDLTVEIPAAMSLDVEDSSGEIRISNVKGGVVIDDSSGEIWAAEIGGGLEIDDSSGEIELRDIEGDLDIDDSSGEIDVQRVSGSVTVRDSSGDIDVREVDGDVVVRSDDSGDISVVDVGGDFVVKRDGSGGIFHEGVGGTVDIPRSD